jgi:hypothetical protein
MEPSLEGGSGRKIKVMKEGDPRWVLIADAYDGLQEVGPVTIKAGRAVYHWIYRNKSVRAHIALDVRYRNSIVELDKSLPPEVIMLSAGGENCTLVLTV